MASTIDMAQDRSVSLGRVFNRGFGTVGGNPLATLGIAFLFGALPGQILGYFTQQLRGPVIVQLGTGGTVAVWIVAAVLGIVFSMLTQGALVRATVAHAEGRRAGFGESAMAGLTIVVPLFLLSLIIALAVGIGMILLIVPGVILYVIWSVAAPALVTERTGVFAAIGRSADLTRGARWKVFGILLVLLVISWITAGVVGAAAMAAYGGVAGFAAAMQGGAPIWYMAANAAVQTVLSAVNGAVLAALYIELRHWKDGPDADALADIFA